jgi:hypothetical protein
MEKIVAPHRDSNSDLLVVQPIASRYTDWAIPPLNFFLQNLIVLLSVFGSDCTLDEVLPSVRLEGLRTRKYLDLSSRDKAEVRTDHLE